MRPIGNTLKRFLSAEEVPRWFGFSVVLIYLVGLGAVMDFGVAHARDESTESSRRISEYSLGLLAKRFETIDPAASDAKADYQRELRAMAETFSFPALRIVNSRGTIVASVGAGDLNSSSSSSTALDSMPLPGLSGARGTNSNLYRVPIRVTGAQPSPESAEAGPGASVKQTVLFLEALPAGNPAASANPVDRARVAIVVLIALGVLFGLFRCLRGQLRGVRRIADQLTTPRDRLEDDLDSLRIADTTDAVTASWNDLIDLTQRLAQTVERSQADRELSLALQKSGGGALSEALDCLPEGIIYITDGTQFEYVNSSARRLLEWEAAAGGSRIAFAVNEAKANGVGGKVLDLFRGALQGDGSFKTITETVTEENEHASSTYCVRVIAPPHTQRFGECIVVIRDISQQIRADRSREEFITQVTHELRTPLTNIRAYAETLSSGMFDDPAVVTECYNVITKETRRLSRLIEDILSVSQLDAGSIELQFDKVDLKTLLDEAVRDVRGLADEKSIDLQLVLPAKLEPIRADRDKLAVVINNLLGNAIKYTSADGNIVVGCQCTSDETAITIKDNGIGIDPSEHGRVFEKFARSKDPSIQNETGTGIGLYTAREIVRHHHGEIDLVSEKGTGSTFMVRLPRQATRATSLTTTEEA